MRVFPVWLLLWLSPLGIQAQEYVIEHSSVTFFREASVENIAATNSKSTGRYEPEGGTISFEIPITEFQFKKSLMRKHFNEKYMESGQFPVASFNGQLLAFSATKKGPQAVHALGKLNIHGVSREVDIPGTAQMTDGYLTLQSKFTIQFSDYQVRIPELFWKSVAESVDVTIDFKLKSTRR